MPLSHLALLTGARGPAMNCLTACAASTQAIGEATEILRRGDADVMIGGGAHSMIHPFGVTGFNRLTALSTANAESRQARAGRSTPSAADLSWAKARAWSSSKPRTRPGARRAILAEVAGYGSTADAYRITDQDPNGAGAIVAMREALADAKLTPADIDYINAHGTGTRENDGNETSAIKSVFGDSRAKMPRQQHQEHDGPPDRRRRRGGIDLLRAGHPRQHAPPTMNLKIPDPECDLDYVPNQARKARVDVAMSNSFGFGGQNDTIIVKRFPGLKD
jgi:3-oxoacyl-[acyl-carrier-protein] synthase II